MLGLSRRGRLVKQGSLFADQRGAVAFEMLIVFAFLILVLLLPLADMAIAGFKFISARQALRAFGQSILYSPPLDVTDLTVGDWLRTARNKAAANSRFPISDPQVLCNGSICTATTAADLPKSYLYSTTFTLAPMVLGSVLCPPPNVSCSFTLDYTERFQ